MWPPRVVLLNAIWPSWVRHSHSVRRLGDSPTASQEVASEWPPADPSSASHGWWEQAPPPRLQKGRVLPADGSSILPGSVTNLTLMHKWCIMSTMPAQMRLVDHHQNPTKIEQRRPKHHRMPTRIESKPWWLRSNRESAQGRVSELRSPPKSHLESVELSELLDLFGKHGGILLRSYLDCNWSLIAITIILHGSSKWKGWIPSLYHRPKQWIFEWKAFNMTLHNYIKFDPPQNGWHLNHLIIPKKTYVFHPAELPPQLVGFTEGLFDVDHGWTNIYFYGKWVVIFPGKNRVGISGQIKTPRKSKQTTIFQSGWWVSQPPSILVGVKIILQKGTTHFSKWWLRLSGDEWKPEMKLKKVMKTRVMFGSTPPTHLENIGKKVPFFEATKVAVLRGNSSWWKWTSQLVF